MKKSLPLQGEKRTYAGVTLAVLLAFVGLVLVRIIASYIPIDTSEFQGSLTFDAIITPIIQIVINFGVPFAVYFFYLKMKPKQIFVESNFKRVRWYQYLLAVALGVCVFTTTMIVASVWSSLLDLLGYTNTSGSVDLPTVFNGGYFVAEILLTALLPAFCEEFLMRGMLVNSLKKAQNTVFAILVGGVLFGLFHQNIRQFFYASCMGFLMVFLTLKFRSIFPAMIVHFMNNFLNIYTNYATTYDWFGANAINGLFSGSVLASVVLIMLAICGVGIVLLMLFLRSRDKTVEQIEVVKNSAFDNTNNRVVLFGEENQQKVEELEMVDLVYGDNAPKSEFKPRLRDNMFLIGGIVLSTLTTLFTFIWGFFL